MYIYVRVVLIFLDSYYVFHFEIVESIRQSLFWQEIWCFKLFFIMDSSYKRVTEAQYR